MTDGVHKVFDLVWRSKDKGLVEKYGLWMLRHDVERALRVRPSPSGLLVCASLLVFGGVLTFPFGGLGAALH